MSQEEDPCPILTLPDEVLCQIFSFITDIPTKMRLEMVCSRFGWISCKQQSSWSGSDALTINSMCNATTEKPKPMIEYFADCCKPTPQYFPALLNGCNIPLEKWPEAAEQQLERTTIRKLCLHIDDSKLFTNDHMERILEIFPILEQDYCHKLKLNCIEFHRRSGQFLRSIDYAGDMIFFRAVEQSQETLEKIVVVLEDDPLAPFARHTYSLICSVIQKCTKLKSFVVQPTQRMPFHEMAEALEGKALENLTIAGDIPVFHQFQENNHGDPMEQSILAVCAGSTCGVKSLTMKTETAGRMANLTMFSNSLDGRSRASLEKFSIRNTSDTAMISNYLSHLNNLPQLYPNLRHLQLELPESVMPLHENLLLNTDFFNNCSQRPNVDLKVLINYVQVDDINQFKERLITACEAKGISAEFAAGEESWVIMSQGNGIIELRNVHEEEEVESSSSESEDSTTSESDDESEDMDGDFIDDGEEVMEQDD